MHLKETPPLDYVAWAKRANARWIVHQGLGQNAESYLGYLAKENEARLIPSCRNAYLMVWLRDSMEDPKPWFYSGLFSLTTAEEAERFLANHWLTRIVIAPDTGTPVLSEKKTGELAHEKIARIREAMLKLPEI